MKTPVFKPEEFSSMIFTDHSIKQVKEIFCDFANAKLQQLIDASPVVYWNERDNDYSNTRAVTDTHKAVLFNIEQLPKQPCNHEPKLIEGNGFGVALMLDNNTCRHCGVELVAEWKAK